MSTLWSGRFAAEPDAEVFNFGKSLPVDRRLIEDDITGSQAWAAALAKAGVKRGLSAESASTIALETVLGTAWMAASTGEDMDSVARRVASPKGTTEAGLAVLDREHVLDELIAVTIQAAARRGAELAEEARASSLEEPARLP